MHEGHRQRLYQKLKEGNNLYEHELLEILLYNAYPRIDTNPIAHRLLERFSSISAILEASPEELSLVEGVGEQTALYLACIGKCLQMRNKSNAFTTLKNYSDMREFAYARLKGAEYEKLEIYFLDKSGKVLRVCSYTQGNVDQVALTAAELGKELSISHPYGMYCAHNHVLCGAAPSCEDNEFTKKCQLLCSTFNIEFYDHIIFGPDGDYYSYFTEGKIDKIRARYSVRSILNHDT